MLVRCDLPPEQQLVQAVHAAYEAGRFAPLRCYNLVVCAVPDEATLLDYVQRLEGERILHVLFHEPDLADRFAATGEGVPTAIATQPVTAEQRKLFANLPCWRTPMLQAS